MKNQFLLYLNLLLAICLSGQSLTPEVVSSSGDYFEGANASLSWTLGELATETFDNGNNILTQGFQQTWPESGYELSLKVFLEGPFTGSIMNTLLNGLPDFPLMQPYSGVPWNYTGTESITSVPNPDIVDWILVELRDAPDATSATSATMVAQQAAFLLNDGSVVGMDGASSISFTEPVTQSLFVAIWHRNHLGVLANNPLVLNGGVYIYDFSTGANQVYGGFLGHKEIATGVWGMVGGDGDALGQINNVDKNEVWSPQAGSSGYLAGDFSMDSQVNNLDKNDIWVPNGGKGTQVPDSTPPGGFKCMIPD